MSAERGLPDVAVVGAAASASAASAEMSAPTAMAAMSASALRRWMRLEHHARRRGVWSWWLIAWVVGGGALAAYAARHTIWLVPWGALAIAIVGAVVAAPFAMFWRRDARLWQRLALPQRGMFDVALLHLARRNAWLLAPVCVLAALQRQPTSPLIATLAAYVWVTGAGAGAVFLGGLMVASDKTRALVDTLAGEFRPPRVVWLGAMPAVVGGVAVAGVWLLAGGVARTSLLLGAAALGLTAVILLLLARTASAVHFSRALTEVVALDRQSLAHVEIQPISPIEALWCRLWAGAALPLWRVTFLVLRRRYPMRGLWLAMGIGAVVAAPWLAWPRWVVAAVALVLLAALDVARVSNRDVALPRLATVLGVARAARGARLAALALHLALFGLGAVVALALLGWR